jgi:multiple sugar transport system ATP-binding protein
MSEVVLSNLTKVFPGGTIALDDVSLTVADSEFVVLVGPSGCGKSTLLRIVAGLEEATSGTVAIDGRVVNDDSPRDRDIAMVFQNYALYPHMSVDQNLAFSLKLRKTAKTDIRRQVTDTARVLGLEQLLDRKPAALSGGQRQRVAMGRAIVRRPRVFLMDEPLSNLDAKLRVAMRGELTRLHQRFRTTTLYVTHDQVEAMTLGDRIAVLDRGRLQQVGTPDELYRFPSNVFVAGFIGSPAMNLAQGRLERCAGDTVLAANGYRWPLPPAVLRARPALASFVDREVVFGLRPEAIDVDDGQFTVDAARITVSPVTIESLGNEKNVLFMPPFQVADATGEVRASLAEGGDSELTAMWTANVPPAADLTIGKDTTLVLDLAAAYFFDAATGEAIPTGEG